MRQCGILAFSFPVSMQGGGGGRRKDGGRWGWDRKTRFVLKPRGGIVTTSLPTGVGWSEAESTCG